MMNATNINKKQKKRKKKRKANTWTDFFFREKIETLDYRNINILKRFLNQQGHILPQLFTKLIRKHQRQVSLNIKRAREMALLPYVVRSLEDQEELAKR